MNMISSLRTSDVDQSSIGWQFGQEPLQFRSSFLGMTLPLFVNSSFGYASYTLRLFTTSVSSASCVSFKKVAVELQIPAKQKCA